MITTEDVEIVNSAQVPAGLADYAREKITKLGRYTARPILHVRITLTSSSDPAVQRPVRAQASLDVNGWLLRGHAEAATPREAIDLLHAQLRRRMSQLEPHRHGTMPRRLPRYVAGPHEQRQIVRHRAYEPPRTTVDEAVFDLDLFGYDFHLFTDERTGQDAVVYRAGPTGYRLAWLRHAHLPADTAVPLTVSPHAAPRLTTREAIDRLTLTGQRFVFYTDTNTDRGCLLYHRDDGNYGLIGPPARTR
jgi:ribosome-associated translation inhibitor RaiA